MKKPKIKMEVLRKPTKNDLRDINILMPQTAAKPHLFSMKELKSLIGQGWHCNLIVARHEIVGKMPIVGMAVVVLVDALTGRLAIIEDVIVDSAFRGKGLGALITKKMVEVAKKLHAKHISLQTTKNSASANAMYQRAGFFMRDINYYRINLFLPHPSSKKAVAKMAKIKEARVNLLNKNAKV